MGLEENLFQKSKKLRRTLLAGLASSVLFFGCGDNIVDPPPIKPPIQKTNRPPRITSSPITQIDENSFYEYKVQATDPDGDKLNYTLVEKPSWLSISGNRVSGTAPEVLEDASSPVKVKVSDGKLSDEQAYNLKVNNLFNSYVLSTNQLQGVWDDFLWFLEPMNFEVGDILVADTSEITPYGLLREITAISGSREAFGTQQATLEKVIREGSFSFSGTLSQSDVQSISSPREGVSLAPSSQTQSPGFGLRLNNVVLYDRDGNPFTTSDQLVANGRIELDLDFDFDVDVSLIKLKSLDFGIISTITSDITLGSNALGIAQSKEFLLGPAYYFPPIVIPSPFLGLPIVAVPKLGFYIGINPTHVNPLSVRVIQESSLEMGLKYEGNWNHYADSSINFDFTNPAFSGEWDLNVYATPKITLLFGGVLGASAGIRGNLRLEASQAGDWKLYGGLGAGLGVSMEIFTKNVAAYYRNVIEYEKLLAESGTIDPPDDTFTDPRDGQVYKIIEIGDQTWMAENLDYDSSNSTYYGNNSSYGEIYGRLYDWDGSKQVCPSEWHLPSYGEWTTLFNSLGGTSSSTTGGKMKSTGTFEAGTGRWHSPNTEATNESGFTALPGGRWEDGSYMDEGYTAYFWADWSTPIALAMTLLHDTGYAGGYVVAGNPQGLKYSIRCVEDQ